MHEQTVCWNLLPEKADQFWADLIGDTGIAKDDIKFDKYNRYNGCPPSAKDGDDCWSIGMDYGIPVPNGYSADDVANPKDVVQKALENSRNLQQQISDVLTSLKLDVCYRDTKELIDSISIPVFMIADAVDTMDQVETFAEKIDAEKKKAMILAFLSAVFFFLPVAGEVPGSVAELTTAASVLAILGAAGDIAMGVYTVVDDPDNAPLGILSIVMAPLALTDMSRVAKAANIRRGMSDDDLLKLGRKVGARMATVKKVVGTCRKTL